MEADVQEVGTILAQVAMGICLAACAGLRAFLPLFVVGVAGRLDVLPLRGPFEWMASWPALIIFGVAVLVELLADKFPVIDNALDTVQTFIKPIAGTAVAASVLTELTPLQSAVLGLLVGGSTATGVHVTKAKLRLASTATTLGSGNPILSFLEDVAAFAGSLGALIVPFVVLALGLLLLFGLIWLALWRRRLLRSRSA